MRFGKKFSTACLLTMTIVGFSLLGSSQANAGAGHFTHSTGSGDAQVWAGYGDSIIAGYCGLFCSIKNYASYYADQAAAENGWAVALEGNPHSGETTIQIYDEMSNTHNAELQAADLVIWSAGGNDFLAARDAYASSCDQAALNTAINNFKDDWDLIISLVAAEAQPGAMIRTMDIYYPNPDQDRLNFCGAVSDFEVFYPLLIEAGDYSCNTAAAAGFLCADSLSAMNCDEIDANHTIDPNCYDPSGSNFRDPLDVIKYVGGVATSWPNANNSSMIQSDRTHPGATGHQYIADAHHALGYADGPAAPICGDSICNGGEDAASCPGDCADFCGDNVCTGSESSVDCPGDCGTVCGDGVCNGGESSASCSSDCGLSCVSDGGGAACTASTNCCSGVGNCTGGKPANRVCAAAPISTVCGDGVVEGSEQCEAGVGLADSCTSLGFDSGSLACNGATCQYDTSACVAGSCGASKDACSVNADCCSGNCKNGTCKGN